MDCWTLYPIFQACRFPALVLSVFSVVFTNQRERIITRDQPNPLNVIWFDLINLRFQGRGIFREIGPGPWKTHSSVKSCEIPWFSVNLYQFTFIFEDFVRNDILAYLLPYDNSQLFIHCQSSSTHLHVIVCHMWIVESVNVHFRIFTCILVSEVYTW